ncbi:LysR family transcriptional regulator [Pseudomonas sp. S9]|uniref:LysR family transcriptional regulator n=1 Tax=Pseudomonas sp. S9 TaxID=686578 RepID=UPI000498575E|nr:LysR family transcriptional regulator [Pseudomonas sp. S9]
MDKLMAMRMFVETVEAKGFSAAARKVGLATSSVTRMVDSLEADLGSVLLNRSTRQISLTEAGGVYYNSARLILDAVADADAEVADQGDQPVGVLRVCVPVEFGRSVIIPQLHRLLARYPRLEINLTQSDEIIDLFSQRVDLSVRLGAALVNDNVVCRTIGHFQRWAIASPDYLARHSLPIEPADLSQHQCLAFDFGNGKPSWVFEGAEQSISVAVQGRLRSNNAGTLRQAALDGCGIALLADWLVEEDVRAGRLTRLLEDYQVSPGQAQATINVLYLPNHRMSTRVRVFIEFLQQILAETRHPTPE